MTAKPSQTWGVDVVTSIIDAEHRGEIRVVLHNTETAISIDPNRAVAHILFSPIAMPKIHRRAVSVGAAVSLTDSVMHDLPSPVWWFVHLGWDRSR